jgi:sulfite reductase (ferredoxin)
MGQQKQPATTKGKAAKANETLLPVQMSFPVANELENLSIEFENWKPQAIIEWAIATYGDHLTLACSFGGPSGMVLLDMALRIKSDLPVFYLDTGFLFPETYALVETVAKRYQITPYAVQATMTPEEQAKKYGDALWTREPDQCCQIRKVEPQRAYLKNYAAWITGLRRDQASTRAATPIVRWDAKFGLAKIAPLALWDEREVWSYIIANNVPYNPLHDQNYPSLGCTNCTRAILPGEDMRAGRWSGFQKTECGLHTTSDVSIASQPLTDQEKGNTMAEQTEHDVPGRTLAALGPGAGSKVERIKADSHYLRGAIAEQLQQPTSHFTEDQVQLLKFHGTYQQDDRDERLLRRSEKAYQFMVRSRIPGGVMTADQYLALDEIADAYANETLRITTRQGIQFHGILKEDLHATIHAINASMLSTLAACGDVNRNVMGCPAPSTSQAHAQIEAFAHDIAMHLAPKSQAYHEIWIDGEKTITTEPSEDVEPLYGPTYLPRKFKIGLALPGDNCTDIYTQDVGMVAELDGERLAGFTILIGGGMGATHGKAETYPRLATSFCFITPDQVLPVIEAIVTVQRDYGDRTNRKHARMKYVVEERGIAWFRAETERRLGYSLADPHPLHWESASDHLGWHKQADGNWFLGIFVENGRVKDTDELRLRSGLRHAIKRFKPGIRLTPQQNILLTDIPTKQKYALRALLAKYGIVVDHTSLGILPDSMACPALPTCGLALAEAERALPDIIRQIDADLRQLGLEGESLSIRMTGCPNGCARPYVGDIGIVGRSKDLYNIYIGGDRVNTRLNTLYINDVHRDAIVATLHPLLARWRDERAKDESFGDYCQKIGIETLRDFTPVVTSSILATSEIGNE